MQTWYNALFSSLLYEKRLSVRERNMKLLLESVTYIAIKERVTCIITIETVMCIMHLYHLYNCNRYSHLHNCNKSCHPLTCCRNCHLHMFCRNFKLHNCNRNSHLRNCNRKIHQHTSDRNTICINTTDAVTCVIASCIVPTENATCRIHYRNFHLQKWWQSRGGSRAAATPKMECFVIIVNGFQPLTIITKHSILDVAVALDPPLQS